MLSSPQLQVLRPQQRSLRQEYAEFIEQRIEEYKERLTRTELLSLADDAVRELELASAEQLVLTEVLMLEHVDRLIMKQLNLPTFRKWRHKHVRMRQAQRDAAYWSVDESGPITDIARRLDPFDSALILGEEAIPTALFLAAHQWPVLFIDPTLEAVDEAEKLANQEALAPRLQALVVQLGHWLPDVNPTLVVLDRKSLADLDAPLRVRALDAFKRMTKPGGIHCFLPSGSTDGILAPAVVRAHYGDWSTQHPHTGTDGWFLVRKP